MNPVYILVEAKKEYTSQLQKILSPRLYEGFKSIYEDILQLLSNEVEEKNVQSSSIVKTFQKMLREIPQWNQEMIKKEYSRIEKISNCDYFEDLLEAIFITITKILTSVQINDNKSQNIKINIPQGAHFIHKCYMECAKEIYKNPYIYDQSKILNPKEKHNNLREALSLIELSINNAIRDLLPIRDILKQGITKFNNEDFSAGEISNLSTEEEKESDIQADEEDDDENEEIAEDPQYIENQRAENQDQDQAIQISTELEEEIKSEEEEKFNGVFRKLQTPASPLPGQALQGFAEIDEIKKILTEKYEQNIKLEVKEKDGVIIEPFVSDNNHGLIDPSNFIETEKLIQRIPGGLVPKAETLESFASYRLQEIPGGLALEAESLSDQPISKPSETSETKNIVLSEDSKIVIPISSIPSNEPKKIILLNSSSKGKNSFTPFVKEIKSKNFLKNKSMGSDKGALFYKKKYEENSANYHSISDVKPSLTNLSELTKEKIITKNQIMLEDNSSDEENDEIILD